MRYIYFFLQAQRRSATRTNSLTKQDIIRIDELVKDVAVIFKLAEQLDINNPYPNCYWVLNKFFSNHDDHAAAYEILGNALIDVGLSDISAKILDFNP